MFWLQKIYTPEQKYPPQGPPWTPFSTLTMIYAGLYYAKFTPTTPPDPLQLKSPKLALYSQKTENLNLIFRSFKSNSTTRVSLSSIRTS